MPKRNFSIVAKTPTVGYQVSSMTWTSTRVLRLTGVLQF